MDIGVCLCLIVGRYTSRHVGRYVDRRIVIRVGCGSCFTGSIKRGTTPTPTSYPFFFEGNYVIDFYPKFIGHIIPILK